MLDALIRRTYAGVFEDAWKTKVICWIHDGSLHMKPASAAAVDKKVMTGQETFDMAKWKPEKGDKGRVLLAPQSGEPLHLRADTEEEANLWVEKLVAARTVALKRAKELDMKQSMQIAKYTLAKLDAQDHDHVELELVEREKKRQQQQQQQEQQQKQQQQEQAQQLQQEQEAQVKKQQEEEAQVKKQQLLEHEQQQLLLQQQVISLLALRGQKYNY
jgi:hypothetical protein